MSTTENPAGHAFFSRIYNLNSIDDHKAVYDDWAASYDKDVLDPSQDYVAPTLVAQAVLTAKGNVSGTVYDAGCGTGLSGVAMAQAGAKTIDGVDVSPGMLKVAKKTGAYRNLSIADLSKAIDKESETYDVVTCVGTFTKGHVGPDPALREFIRILKKGGIVSASVLEDIWVPDGYKTEVEKLSEEGLIEVVSAEKMDYRRGAGVKARVLVLRKR